jgi:hypothetical protein
MYAPVMKTSLKFLSLFLAASLPGALAAEFAGVALPAGFDATSAFAAFVVSLIILTAHGDYSRRARMLTTTVAVRTDKAVHALAA